MTTLILAEKPSVARDIARVLGATARHDGYLQGQGYAVTWALGHLVHFAEPDDYGPEWAGRWKLAQLPMIPPKWRLRTDKKTAAQFKIVKTLLNADDTERVVCATDAGREGEAIFRLIYQHAHCTKPVERLWISSLTDEAIRAGLQALKPGAAFDPLAAAARARAQADWLIGMNLTRAYTVTNQILCTIGRVQTPTLAMIVARDAAIAAFEKAYFYELVAHLREGFDARLSRDGETRTEHKAEAEALHRKLSPHQTGEVTDITRKERRQRPLPLYDLTNLQRDGNRHFGFTAAKTLELAQQLYEQYKLISYPRTESRHISEDMLPQLPGILQVLTHPLAPLAAERLAGGHKLGKAYVDKTRLTDHHAILPTQTRAPESLPEPPRRIYDLVCARFVGVFLPDQRVLDINAQLEIGGACFVAHAARVLDPGWKAAEYKSPRASAAPGAKPETEPPETAALAALEKGQIVNVTGMEVVEKETQAPRPYDDASLLNAMKHAGREIEDEALAAAMKDSGLGTPATRAEIIEKLIRTGYVERQRKQLRAAEKGRVLIGLVAEPLRSPELTAAWEQRLKSIEQGEADAPDFYQDICAFVARLIPQVAQGPKMTAEQIAAARAAEPGKGATGKRKGKRAAERGGSSSSTVRAAGLGPCPVCKSGEITENARAFGCSRYREGCGFTIWKTIASHALTPGEVKQLIESSHSSVIADFRSKAGKPFSARLRLDEHGKVQLDFDQSQRLDASERASPPPARSLAKPTAPSAGFGQCPKCGLGQIIRGHRGYGCNRYREGCDFVIWREQFGAVLDEGHVRALLEQGVTQAIEGPTGFNFYTDRFRLCLTPAFDVVRIAEGDANPAGQAAEQDFSGESQDNSAASGGP